MIASSLVSDTIRIICKIHEFMNTVSKYSSIFSSSFFLHFVTDLDDTLYPASTGIASACKKNIEGTLETISDF